MGSIPNVSTIKAPGSEAAGGFVVLGREPMEVSEMDMVRTGGDFRGLERWADRYVDLGHPMTGCEPAGVEHSVSLAQNGEWGQS